MRKILLFCAVFVVTAHTIFAAADETGAVGNGSVGSALVMKSIKQKFLREANDPKSSLGKIIAKINKETEDGRNHIGTIALPIKASAVRVVRFSHETITNPWHYADKTGQRCTTNHNESSFLVLLDETTGVHMALEQESVVFTVATRETLTTDILENSTEFCDPLVDEKAKFSPAKSTLQIDEFVRADITDAK